MAYVSYVCYVPGMAAEPRVVVNFRTAPESRDWMDKVAAEHRVDRSDVIRAAVAMAYKQQAELDKTIEARR